jgi:hypothetical protein
MKVMAFAWVSISLGHKTVSYLKDVCLESLEDFADFVLGPEVADRIEARLDANGSLKICADGGLRGHWHLPRERPAAIERAHYAVEPTPHGGLRYLPLLMAANVLQGVQ